MRILLTIGFFVCACNISQETRNGILFHDSELTEILSGQAVSQTDKIAISTVIVVLKDKSGVSNYCSGTVISEKYALTAAHCLVGWQGVEIQSYFGFATPILKMIPHPKYKRDAKLDRYDIALIEFIPAIGFQTNVVVSDSETDPNSGVLVMIAGYGRTQINQKSLQLLNKLEVFVAKDSYSNSEIEVTEPADAGSCFGDSGGPGFVVKDNSLFLWGVSSRAPVQVESGCGKAQIYTKVSACLDWIRKETSQ